MSRANHETDKLDPLAAALLRNLQRIAPRPVRNCSPCRISTPNCFHRAPCFAWFASTTELHCTE